MVMLTSRSRGQLPPAERCGLLACLNLELEALLRDHRPGFQGVFLCAPVLISEQAQRSLLPPTGAMPCELNSLELTCRRDACSTSRRHAFSHSLWKMFFRSSNFTGKHGMDDLVVDLWNQVNTHCLLYFNSRLPRSPDRQTDGLLSSLENQQP